MEASNLIKTDAPALIYPDQNVLSAMRDGETDSEGLRWVFRKLADNNAHLVCSQTHIEESRASSRPEDMALVLEQLPVYFLDIKDASDPVNRVLRGRGETLIREAESEVHLAQMFVCRILDVMHASVGWLDDVDVRDLKVDMEESANAFWDPMFRDIQAVFGEGGEGKTARERLNATRDAMAAIIRDLPIEQARREAVPVMTMLRDRMPSNFAQLDDVPDQEAVAFVLACMDETEKHHFQCRYPADFWASVQTRVSGELCGLAFGMYLCGLVRDRRAQKGALAKRRQRFLAQFRDCLHIEHASRCHLFVTFDQGAARLARAVYGYAGVETKVVELARKMA